MKREKVKIVQINYKSGIIVYTPFFRLMIENGKWKYVSAGKDVLDIYQSSGYPQLVSPTLINVDNVESVYTVNEHEIDIPDEIFALVQDWDKKNP